MRPTLALAVLASLVACGSREPAAAGNDTARITNQISQQAAEIRSQAENGAAAIEQALENEGAAMFDNRAALLNESADAAAGNRQR